MLWRKRLICRFVSLAMVIVFTVSEALFLSPKGFAGETPAAFPDHASLEIPSELGRIDEVHDGRSGKKIVFIQDAHDSLEAQENIARLIEHLVARQGVQTVFEEGYEGPVPTDLYFGWMKDEETRKQIAHFLLDQLRLSGSEYAHILRRRPFKLIGVDRAALHRRNIRQYQRSLHVRRQIEKDLDVLEEGLNTLAANHFSPKLKEWLDLKRRLTHRQLPPEDYLRRSYALLPEKSRADLAPQLPLISLLADAAGMPTDPDQLKKIQTEDPREIIDEIERLEDGLGKVFLQGDLAGKIYRFLKLVFLLNRLNSLEMTRREYQSLRTLWGKNGTRAIGQLLAEENGKPLALSKRWERNIRDAVAFYGLAHQRDQSIAKSLDSFLKDPDEQTAVLVFGGFHKEGIRQILRSKDISYVIVTPKISEISPKHQQYYKQLMSVGRHSYETSWAVKTAVAPERIYSGVRAENFPDYLTHLPLTATQRHLLASQLSRLTKREKGRLELRSGEKHPSFAFKTQELTARQTEMVYETADWMVKAIRKEPSNEPLSESEVYHLNEHLSEVKFVSFISMMTLAWRQIAIHGPGASSGYSRRLIGIKVRWMLPVLLSPVYFILRTVTEYFSNRYQCLGAFEDINKTIYLNPKLRKADDKFFKRIVRHELMHALGYDENELSFLGYLEDAKVPFNETEIKAHFPSPVIAEMFDRAKTMGFPELFAEDNLPEHFERTRGPRLIFPKDLVERDHEFRRAWKASFFPTGFFSGHWAGCFSFKYWYQFVLLPVSRFLRMSRMIPSWNLRELDFYLTRIARNGLPFEFSYWIYGRILRPVERALRHRFFLLKGIDPAFFESYLNQSARLGMVIAFISSRPGLTDEGRYQYAKVMIARAKDSGLAAAAKEIDRMIVSRSELRSQPAQDDFMRLTAKDFPELSKLIGELQANIARAIQEGFLTQISKVYPSGKDGQKRIFYPGSGADASSFFIATNATEGFFVTLEPAVVSGLKEALRELSETRGVNYLFQKGSALQQFSVSRTLLEYPNILVLAVFELFGLGAQEVAIRDRGNGTIELQFDWRHPDDSVPRRRTLTLISSVDLEHYESYRNSLPPGLEGIFSKAIGGQKHFSPDFERKVAEKLSPEAVIVTDHPANWAVSLGGNESLFYPSAFEEVKASGTALKDYMFGHSKVAFLKRESAASMTDAQRLALVLHDLDGANAPWLHPRFIDFFLEQFRKSPEAFKQLTDRIEDIAGRIGAPGILRWQNREMITTLSKYVNLLGMLGDRLEKENAQRALLLLNSFSKLAAYDNEDSDLTTSVKLSSLVVQAKIAREALGDEQGKTRLLAQADRLAGSDHGWSVEAMREYLAEQESFFNVKRSEMRVSLDPLTDGEVRTIGRDIQDVLNQFIVLSRLATPEHTKLVVMQTGSVARNTFVIESARPDGGVDFDYSVSFRFDDDSAQKNYSRDAKEVIETSIGKLWPRNTDGYSSENELFNLFKAKNYAIRADGDKSMGEKWPYYHKFNYLISKGNREFKVEVNVSLRHKDIFAERAFAQLEFMKLDSEEKNNLINAIRGLKVLFKANGIYFGDLTGAMVEQLIMQSSARKQVRFDPLRIEKPGSIKDVFGWILDAHKKSSYSMKWADAKPYFVVKRIVPDHEGETAFQKGMSDEQWRNLVRLAQMHLPNDERPPQRSAGQDDDEFSQQRPNDRAEMPSRPYASRDEGAVLGALPYPMLRELYGFKNVSALKLLYGGGSSKIDESPVLIEADGENYVLRHLDDPEKTTHILAYQRKQKEKGNPVPGIIKTLQGGDVFYDADKTYYLEEYLTEGAEVNAEELTERHYAGMGKMLARLHNAVEGKTNEEGVNRRRRREEIVDFSKDMAARVGEIKRQDSPLTESELLLTHHYDFLMSQFSAFAANYQKYLGRHVADIAIHGDFAYTNLRFYADGEVSAIFDLTRAHNTKAIVDLNQVIFGRKDVGPIRFNPGHFISALEAYQKEAVVKLGLADIRGLLEVFRSRFLEDIYNSLVNKGHRYYADPALDNYPQRVREIREVIEGFKFFVDYVHELNLLLEGIESDVATGRDERALIAERIFSSQISLQSLPQLVSVYPSLSRRVKGGILQMFSDLIYEHPDSETAKLCMKKLAWESGSEWSGAVAKTGGMKIAAVVAAFREMMLDPLKIHEKIYERLATHYGIETSDVERKEINQMIRNQVLLQDLLLYKSRRLRSVGIMRSLIHDPQKVSDILAGKFCPLTGEIHPGVSCGRIRCKFCYNAQVGPGGLMLAPIDYAGKENALSWEGIKRLADDYIDSGVKEIYVSGGKEPWYSGEFKGSKKTTVDLIRYLHEKKPALIISMLTVGLELYENEEVRKTAVEAMDILRISLDSSSPEGYDDVKGLGYLVRDGKPTDTFEKVRLGIAKTLELRRGTQGKSRLRIGMSFTCSEQNYHELETFLKIAAEWGVDFVDVKGVIADPKSEEKISAYREYIAKLYDLSLKGAFGDLTVYFHENFFKKNGMKFKFDEELKPTDESKPDKCYLARSGMRTAVVIPNGRAFVCVNSSQPGYDSILGAEWDKFRLGLYQGAETIRSLVENKRKDPDSHINCRNCKHGTSTDENINEIFWKLERDKQAGLSLADQPFAAEPDNQYYDGRAIYHRELTGGPVRRSPQDDTLSPAGPRHLPLPDAAGSTVNARAYAQAKLPAEMVADLEARHFSDVEIHLGTVDDTDRVLAKANENGAEVKELLLASVYGRSGERCYKITGKDGSVRYMISSVRGRLSRFLAILKTLDVPPSRIHIRDFKVDWMGVYKSEISPYIEGDVSGIVITQNPVALAKQIQTQISDANYREYRSRHIQFVPVRAGGKQILLFNLSDVYGTQISKILQYAALPTKLGGLGVKNFLLLGECGGIGPDMRRGDLILPTHVYKDGHNVGTVDSEALAVEVRGLVSEAAGGRVLTGAIETIPTILSEDEGQMLAQRKKNILGIELELAHVIRFLEGSKEIRFNAILEVTDLPGRPQQRLGDPGFNPRSEQDIMRKLAAKMIAGLMRETGSGSLTSLGGQPTGAVRSEMRSQAAMPKDKFEYWLTRYDREMRELLKKFKKNQLMGHEFLRLVQQRVRHANPAFKLSVEIDPKAEVTDLMLAYFQEDLTKQVIEPNGYVTIKDLFGRGGYLAEIIPARTEHLVTPGGLPVTVYGVEEPENAAFEAMLNLRDEIIYSVTHETRLLEVGRRMQAGAVRPAGSDIEPVPLREEPQVFLSRVYSALFKQYDLEEAVGVMRRSDLTEEMSHADALHDAGQLSRELIDDYMTDQYFRIAGALVRPNAFLQQLLAEVPDKLESRNVMGMSVFEVEGKLSAIANGPAPAYAFLNIVEDLLQGRFRGSIDRGEGGLSRNAVYFNVGEIILELLAPKLLNKTENVQAHDWLDFLEKNSRKENEIDLTALEEAVRPGAAQAYREQFLSAEERKARFEMRSLEVLRLGALQEQMQKIAESGMSVLKTGHIPKVLDAVKSGEVKLLGESLDVIGVTSSGQEVVLGALDRNIVHLYFAPDGTFAKYMEQERFLKTGAKQLLHRVANILITTPDGRLIFRQGFRKNDGGAGTTNVFGGHVLSAVSYAETAEKELKEELGFPADYRLQGKWELLGAEGQYYAVRAWEPDRITFYRYIPGDEEIRFIEAESRRLDARRAEIGEEAFADELKALREKGEGGGEVWAIHLVPLGHFDEALNKINVGKTLLGFIFDQGLFDSLQFDSRSEMRSQGEKVNVTDTFYDLGHSTDLPQAKSKARSFDAFEKLGLDYPPGVVIRANTVREILTGREDFLEAMIREIRKRFESGIKVAVRSSPLISMPGRMKSLLNIDIADTQALAAAILDVARSWDSPEAVEFRKSANRPDDQGTEIVIQQMAPPGNIRRWASGAFFTKDPEMGGAGPVGQYLLNSHGDSLMTGGQRGEQLIGLSQPLRDRLKSLSDQLEKYFGFPQEVEFLISFKDASGDAKDKELMPDKIWLLSSRDMSFSPQGEIRFLKNVQNPFQRVALLEKIQRHRSFKIVRKQYGLIEGEAGFNSAKALTWGQQVGGAMQGFLVTRPESFPKYEAEKKPVILLMTPETQDAMLAIALRYPAVGVITNYGNETSHESVLFRLAGIPAVIDANFVIEGNQVRFSDRSIHRAPAKEGQEIWLMGNGYVSLPWERKVIEENKAINDITFGMDLELYKQEITNAFLTPEGKVKAEVTYPQLVAANADAWASYIEMDSAGREKEAFGANIRKHYLHEILSLKGAEEGREQEVIRQDVVTALLAKLLPPVSDADDEHGSPPEGEVPFTAISEKWMRDGYEIVDYWVGYCPPRYLGDEGVDAFRRRYNEALAYSKALAEKVGGEVRTHSVVLIYHEAIHADNEDYLKYIAVVKKQNPSPLPAGSDNSPDAARREMREQAEPMELIPEVTAVRDFHADDVVNPKEDVVFVIEQKTIDALSPELWRELIGLALIHKTRLHLVIPDALRSGDSTRVEQLKGAARVHFDLPGITRNRKVRVLALSDTRKDIRRFREALGGELSQNVYGYLGADRPGDFSVALLYAIGDVLREELGEKNGYLHDEADRFTSRALETLYAAYEVIVTAA